MATLSAGLVLPDTAKALWRWYAVLLLANALDLLFTYVAVERGIEELNPVLRPLLLTPWPTVGKTVAFCLLAVSLWMIVKREGNRLPVLSMLRGAAVAYLVVIVFHLLGLLANSA